MIDLKYLSKKSARRRKVELRWWWFTFDLRHHRSAIYDVLSAVLLIAVALTFATIMYIVGCQAMGIPIKEVF